MPKRGSDPGDASSSAQACAAMAERSHRRKPRKADRPNDSVDQTRIWKHDITQEIIQSAACADPFQPMTDRLNKRDNTHMYIRKREHAIQPRFRTRRFRTTPYVLNQFVPNAKVASLNLRDHAFCGTHSSDGRVFMSACQDRGIRLYDTETYSLVKAIRCRDVHWSVLDTDYSPDQRFIVYSSWSPYAHLCSIKTSVGGQDVHTPLNFGDHKGRFCLFSVKFSNDSKYLVGGSNDAGIYVYDLDGERRIHMIMGHVSDGAAYDVNTVAFANDSRSVLYSAGDDGLCKIWDTRTLRGDGDDRPVGVMKGHLQGITHVASKSDGRYLITNGKDHCIKLWDIRKMSAHGRRASQVSGPGTSVDYRYAHDIFDCTKQDRMKEDASLMTYAGHWVQQTLIRARFSSPFATGEKYIVSGSRNGVVFVWDVLSGAIVSQIRAHNNVVRDVSWHPYENTILSSSWDGTVGVLEHDPDEPLPEPTYDYAGTTERRHLKEQASGRPFVSAFINRFLRQNNYQADEADDDDEDGDEIDYADEDEYDEEGDWEDDSEGDGSGDSDGDSESDGVEADA